MTNIVSRITLEVVGAPQEHVNTTMKKVLEKLKADENITIEKAKVYDAQIMEQNNKLFSAFTEIEFATNELKKVLEVCYTYMPSTIEILEPAGMEMDCGDIAYVFNDFLAQLHKYSMVLQRLRSENIVMMRELEKIKGKKVPLRKTTKVKDES